eukprot:766718-Hanusia_phi.AAC.1
MSRLACQEGTRAAACRVCEAALLLAACLPPSWWGRVQPRGGDQWETSGLLHGIPGVKIGIMGWVVQINCRDPSSVGECGCGGRVVRFGGRVGVVNFFKPSSATKVGGGGMRKNPYEM